METIQAMVNTRLLTKADRLFTGTLNGRIIEILQNARRAGATKVVIQNHEGHVSVQDNGGGIESFSKLLDLGGSGWDETLEASEDPAGVGLFCLAPRSLTIRSRGKSTVIEGDGWRGAAVPVESDPHPQPGTVLQFDDERWSKVAVEPHAVFCGMDVVVDGEACAREPFAAAGAAHHPELGCRIEACEYDLLSPWHRSSRRAQGYCDNVLVNFHGQTVSFDYRPVDEPNLWYLIDLTGEPTGIRLMLPARTRLVENAALIELKAALELEAFKYLRLRGHHRLPYKQYLRARTLGIDLAESTPVYRVGLLGNGDAPEPADVTMPEGFPLARCYRIALDQPDGSETDEANTHLLAALGEFSEPFVPVEIEPKYDGYSWAKLPTVGKVELQIGKELLRDSVWSGTVVCVDALRITAHASDGKVFSAPVCMAIAPRHEDQWDYNDVLVTPAAQQLPDDSIWHHLGGWYEDGDTYETQQADFSRQMEEFWAKFVGPDEHLRRTILAATDGIEQSWKSLEVYADGTVCIRFANRKVRTLTPPTSEGER
jgi:hypothetical protein